MVVLPDVPESVQQAALVIRQLLAKPILTRQDRETIHNARLKIVFWACAAENVTPTRDNLAYVLGPDAREVMAAYNQKIREQKPLESAPESEFGPSFWDK